MQPREQFRGTPSSLCFPFLPFLELPRSAAPKGEALGTGKGAHTKGTAGPAKTGQQGSAAKLNVEQVSTAPALKRTQKYTCINIVHWSLIKELSQYSGENTVYSTNVAGTAGHPHGKK